MNRTEKLKLIDGTFSEADAKDILTNIFLAKINFHKLKNFSSQVRFGKDDGIAQKRIPELNEAMIKLEELLAVAKETNKKLIINSEINISISND